MNRKKRAVYSTLRRQERYHGGKAGAPVLKGKLALQASKRSIRCPRAEGVVCAKAQWHEKMGRAYPGTPRSPSVHAERQEMIWAKMLSLQGLGCLAGELGFHPEHWYDTARLALQRERTPAAVSIHPNAPCFQVRNLRTPVGPSLA